MSAASRSKGILALAIALGLLAALLTWIARHTYWADDSVRVPLRGEAARNPFYAAEHFSESLGAIAERHYRLATAPAPTAVLVITAWHWDLNANRRRQLEHWVESGGRLVVDRSLISTLKEFERWSGIERVFEEPVDEEEEEGESRQRDSDRCRTLQPDGYSICNRDRFSMLHSSRRAAWSLHDDLGPQVIRVEVGSGSITVVNSSPFVYRQFLEGDHARLFIAVTQLRRGDEIHFLTEEHHPGLLSLLWQAGGPAISLALSLIALALWRRSVRFGPLTTPPQAARRSLGEQIRGTGQFILRFNDAAALHAATVRALGEAAGARIPGYPQLDDSARAHQLAALTGYEPAALAAALGFTGKRSPELRSAIALLEAARRKISIRKKRSWHASGSEHDYAGG